MNNDFLNPVVDRNSEKAPTRRQVLVNITSTSILPILPYSSQAINIITSTEFEI
jgi:hypothetical protein